MRPEDFNGVAGKVIGTQNGYYTFFPVELPINIDISKYGPLLEEAVLKLGNINGLARLLPNPYIFIDLYIKKEAVKSSKIEGTLSSLSDILIEEIRSKKLETSSIKGRDLLEVVNSINSIQEGVSAIKNGEELSLALLLRLHRTLTKNVRGETKNPGHIRTKQNWIGKPGSSIIEARFVPPEPVHVEGLLANLLSYLNDKQSAHPKLVKIAIAHYQFEAIHPFEDGNGRIGRVLILLCLLKERLLDLPILYLSEYLERNSIKYYDRLLETSKTGAYDTWIEFFLRGVIEQANSVMTTTTKLLDFHNKTKNELKKGRSTLAISVLDDLLSNPYLTIPRVAEKYGVTYPTAKKATDKLISVGALKRGTNKTRRLFVSEPIIRILEEASSPNDQTG